MTTPPPSFYGIEYHPTPNKPPTKRLFFWTVAVCLLAILSAAVISCAGPSEAQAAVAEAQDLGDVLTQLQGARPDHITPDEWVAAKHAALALRNSCQQKGQP